MSDLYRYPETSFGEWLPDQPIISGAYAMEKASGCIMRDGAYRPVFEIKKATSWDAPGQNSGGAGINNIIATGISHNSSGETFTFFVTEKGGIGELTLSGLKWLRAEASGVNIKIASVEQFGSKVAFGLPGFNLRHVDIDTELTYITYSATGGAESSSLTIESDSPQGAAILKTIGAYLFSATGNQIHWCDANRIDRWTDSTNSGLAGSITLNHMGDVLAISGESNAIVFGANTIDIFVPIGGNSVFARRTLLSSVRFLGTNRTTQLYQGRAYAMTSIGIIAVTNEGNVLYIGEGKVDKWLSARISSVNHHDMEMCVDSVENSIYFYLGDENDDNTLIYSVNDGAFSTATYDELIKRLMVFRRGAVYTDTASNVRVNDDGLTISANSDTDSASYANVSTDDPIFSGGDERIAVITQDGQLGFFNGAPQSCALQTKFTLPSVLFGEDIKYVDSIIGRIRVGEAVDITQIKPIRVGGSVRACVLSAYTIDGISDCVGSAAEETTGGNVPVRAVGLYISTEILMSGDWTEVRGIITELTAAGSPISPS